MKRHKLLAYVLLACALTMTGCAMHADSRIPYQSYMSISFDWSRSLGQNPEILLYNVPRGTAYLEVSMRDLRRPRTELFREVISYNQGSRINANSLRDWRNPQHNDRQARNYEITVRALGSDRRMVLGEARSTRPLDPARQQGGNSPAGPGQPGNPGWPGGRR